MKKGGAIWLASDPVKKAQRALGAAWRHLQQESASALPVHFSETEKASLSG